MSENSNTQTPVVPETPAATGPTVAELQAQLDEAKKQSEGRLRDLQDERRKRQDYEQRMANTSPASPPAPESGVTDELGKVLNPYFAPVQKEIAATKQELESMRIEKAQNYLSEKMGKSWASLEADRDFQDKLMAVARKYGITGNVYERTVRAYELVELESLKAKEAERSRQAATASASSMPSGTPPAPVSNAREYSAEDFNKLDTSPGGAFDVLSSKGNFVYDENTNKYVYTPR